MHGEPFFEESKEQSQIKSKIVSKYFWAWANVVSKYSDRIAYIDLFAGPGRYKDGTMSTPLLVLEKAIDSDKWCDKLVAMFNDVDSTATQTLENEIWRLPGVNKLKHRPQINNESVGTEIVQMFEEMSLVPTLMFVDPWGYKGLSLQLINAVLKDWGCECVFFFNYNRINMGITNPAVKDHMDALFGHECADKMRCTLSENCPDPIERELYVVECLVDVINKMGGKFVIPFRFRNKYGKRTSHHLIFVSKALRGYEIMKEVMAKESSSDKQGVASFEYNPASRRQRLLFELSKPLDELADELMQRFAGTTLQMKAVYERHHVGTPFIKKNYKDALTRLEQEGRIAGTPSFRNRRFYKGRPSCADTVQFRFPRKIRRRRRR